MDHGCREAGDWSRESSCPCCRVASIGVRKGHKKQSREKARKCERRERGGKELAGRALYAPQQEANRTPVEESSRDKSELRSPIRGIPTILSPVYTDYARYAAGKCVGEAMLWTGRSLSADWTADSRCWLGRLLVAGRAQRREDDQQQTNDTHPNKASSRLLFMTESIHFLYQHPFSSSLHPIHSLSLSSYPSGIPLHNNILLHAMFPFNRDPITMAQINGAAPLHPITVATKLAVTSQSFQSTTGFTFNNTITESINRASQELLTSVKNELHQYRLISNLALTVVEVGWSFDQDSQGQIPWIVIDGDVQAKRTVFALKGLFKKGLEVRCMTGIPAGFHLAAQVRFL